MITEDLELRIKQALEMSWSGKTSLCYDPEKAPLSYGQCAPTAIVIFENFGGEILRTSVGKYDGTFIRHFYNRIEGRRFDFTEEQFSKFKIESYWQPVRYQDIPSDIAEAESETLPGQLREMRVAFYKAFNQVQEG